jgi:hypothetical protein
MLDEVQRAENAKAPRLRGFQESPLTDSNRRPPPYHAIQTATGGSQWQRFPADPSHFRASSDLNPCHPLRPLCSITVPSQSAENEHFDAGALVPQAREPLRVTGRRARGVTDGSMYFLICSAQSTPAPQPAIAAAMPNPPVAAAAITPSTQATAVTPHRRFECRRSPSSGSAPQRSCRVARGTARLTRRRW